MEAEGGGRGGGKERGKERVGRGRRKWEVEGDG